MSQDIMEEVRASRTDMARIVEAAARDDLPYVIVSAKAVQAWQEREPQAWAKVQAWLASQGKSIVTV
jgi:hypothetical protein